MRAGRQLVAGSAALMLLLALGSGGVALADACPEPNNDAAAACFVLDGTTVLGTIDDPGDRDVYRIQVASAGTKILLELANMPVGSDYDLALVNENLEVVGQSVQEGNAVEWIELTLQAAGNYYAYVWVDQGRDFNPGAPYSLQIVLSGGGAPPAAEPAAPPPAEPPAAEPAAPAAQPPSGPAATEPSAPSGPPAFSNLRCGYDAGGGGAVGAGGQLSPVGETTIHCRFDWQNVPPGSSLVFEFFQDKEARSRETIQLAEPGGSRAVAVNRVGGPGKKIVKVTQGTRSEVEVEEPESYTCEAKIHFNGKEVGSIWFTIG